MSVDHEYLDATHDLYRRAALTPEAGLCCTTAPIWQLPELSIPQRMQEMNYGCGSTVHPRDLVNSPTVLYVGVGGGMRSEEHTSELQSHSDLVCRLLLEKKK